MNSKKTRSSNGFTLLEMLISMAVLLVMSGAALSIINGFSKTYGSITIKSDMDSDSRSAAELLTQEIGQAGTLPITRHTLGAAVVGNSAGTQTVNVGSTTGMYVGQNLFVDVGILQETVVITAIPTATTVTGTFKQSHILGAPVDAGGLFPQGILAASTPTQLMMVGDINGDGTLVYLEYDCVPNAAGTGTLTRSITTLPAVGKNPAAVLLQNLVTNPGAIGNACFTYPAATVANGFSFITSVGLTLSTQSAIRDPQSGAFQTLTKTFMNISPRNILAGLDLAQNNMLGRLEPTPAGLPLP